jgi:predicted ATPase/DNA-binding SARP family transcriptional activator
VGGSVEAGVLGPVELRIDGAPQSLTGVPQRVLLARLALAGGRVVPVGDFVDALWGDEPPDNAVGNLHSYVSRLRRAAGPDAVRREPAGYRLDLPADAVDVARAERLAADARGRAPADRARALAGALALWRGAPLADVADRLAFAPDVARLTEWHRQLRDECLGAWLDAGEAARVLPEVEEAAAAAPLREAPQLLLMRALHLTGRTAQALSVARAYRERVIDGHGVDPGPAVDELQRRILADDPALRPPERIVIAPVRRTPANRFVGRGPELAALDRAVRTGPVVTVVGPGGVGKTRLAREFLAASDGPPPFVVELAELSVPDDVAVAVAGALGLRVAPRGGVAAVAERLGTEPALLVLDNCEHLLEAAADLVTALLARCPQVRVLCTSRRRLAVDGERLLRLGPLPDADRIDLFCDRAALLRADFDGTAPRTRELAAQVCGLLDGLPLAVELAARREAVFGLAQLRDRLSAGLDVLDPVRGGTRANAVSATVEWSYRLLDPAAQTLLDRLAVCRGGFGLAGLAHLADDGDGAPLLAELVDASLVIGDLAADPPRYRLLETVRHVGLAHLGAAGEEAARAAHARWMLTHAAELFERQRVRDPRTTPALRREIANLQEALAWLTRTGRWAEAGRLGALLSILLMDDPHPALIDQLRRLAPETVTTEADALRALAAGTAEWISSGMAAADRLLTAALGTLPPEHPLHWPGLIVRISNAMFAGRTADVHADARAIAANPAVPPWAAAMGVCCAALVDCYAGDDAGAHRWLAEYADVVAAADGADGFVAFTRAELTAVAEPAAALDRYEASLAQSRRISDTYIGLIAAVGRASVLVRLRRDAEAAAACRELLADVRRAGMTAQVWTTLRLVAELLADLGEPAAAAAILAAADADPLAPVVFGPDLERHDRIRAAATGRAPAGLGDTVAFALAALGRHH